tara:strand:- start:919 stop:2373 length:1455 start_codon:yes stop_codon:yes gene_type:complete
MSEVLSYQEFQEAMDSVNPKAVKKKFKDRKDKDIDNDGDVDSSDKYLHKRRKAISKAVKKEDMDEMKDPRDFVKLRSVDNVGPRTSSDTRIIKKTNTKLLSKYKSKGYKVVGMGGKDSGAKRDKSRYTDEFGKEDDKFTRSSDKDQNFKRGLMTPKKRKTKVDGDPIYTANKKKAAKVAEGKYAKYSDLLLKKQRMKKMGQNTMVVDKEIEAEKKKIQSAGPMKMKKEETLKEKGKGLYYNINKKRKEGRPMRKKGEKGAPSEDDFKSAAKTAKEERENCHSKDHDCATVVEHIVWGFGKPVYESHAVPTDDGYVSWYDVEFEHGIEKEVPTEDLKIYTTEAHEKKEKDKKKMLPAKKGKHSDDEEMDEEKYSDSEIQRAVEIAKKMAGSNYTGASNAIEKMKKGLSSVGKVKYALRKAAESFETFNGLTISEVEEIVKNLTDSAQDYIKLVEDGDVKSVDEPEVEPVKGMPLSFKQFKSKIGD